MPEIRVVTDNACDLPESLLRQLDISVVPHSVSWPGDESPAALSTGRIVERMRGAPGEWPRVDAPDIDELTAVYRSLRDTCDGILSVHVSSKVSDSYGNAMIAREAFGPVGQGGPFPVAVVDSWQMSMALGWLVLVLATEASAGAELTKLVARAARLREICHFAFFTESLDGVQAAGRGLRVPHGESIAHSHALCHLDEGQPVVYERTRTRAKARDALYNFVEDFPKIGELAVMHTGAQLDLDHLMTRVAAIYPRDRVMILPTGPAVTAWLGPDALGVAVIEAEENERRADLG